MAEYGQGVDTRGMPPTLEAVRRFVRTQLRLCFGGGCSPRLRRVPGQVDITARRCHGAGYGAVSRRDVVSSRGPRNARLVGVGVVAELGSVVGG